MPTASSPPGSAPRTSAPRESAPRESASSQSASSQSAPRESAPRESAARESAARESGRGGSPHRGPARSGSASAGHQRRRADGEPLEAIVLVGGKGTRLRPLTTETPKPLLPTAGVPFLAHQFAKAAAAGVTRVVLATSYRAQMFDEVFGDGSGFGLEIEYVHEAEPLDTGGGIRNAASCLRSGAADPVVVLNGDVLSGHDLAAQLDLHRKADAAVTLHLVDVPDPSRFGCVPTDAAGRVTAFLEKTPEPVTSQINAGCYVFARHVIDEMPAGRVLSVERETFPALVAAGRTVMGFVDNAYWLDVGTPEAFVRGSSDLVRGVLLSLALPGAPGPALVLPGATIDRAAELTGGTVIGAGSTVAADARVDGAVIFDGVVIGEGARITASAVGAGARIGPGVVLDGVVIGAGADIGARNELARGLRVWPGVRLGDTAIRFSTDA